MSTELIADLPPALKDHASWLINAGADDTARILSQMEATPEAIRILKAAIATERAKPKLQQRVSRLKPIEAKLRKFESEVPHKSPLEILADKTAAERLQPVEIVTAAQVDTAELAGLAQAITRSREIIHKHEAACHETTLEHYLDAGQMLARAQEIFTLSHSDKMAIARDGKALLSTVDNRDQTPPEILANRGFSAWLAKEIPNLKRPTAIRYATAYRALDLPLTAKPAEIRAALKTLRHKAGKAGAPMPTLAALVRTAPKPPKAVLMNLVPVTMSPQQLALEDAREAFHLWREAFEKLLRQGSLDDLDKPGLLELKEFAATVRDRVNARLK